MSKSTKPIRIEISLDVMFQTVNCYLVPGEALTLIDCGWYSEENWAKFQEEIGKHGYQVSDIEQVIVTHEHRDHIGLLPEIISHSKAVIRAPKVIEGWFTHPEEMIASSNRFVYSLFQKLDLPKEILKQLSQYLEWIQLTRKVPSLDRFEYFEEGDFLTIGYQEWEVMNTPGHCPSQFVFYQKEHNSIFGSDMLLPVTPMPIIVEDPKHPGQATKALNDLLTSFKRLYALDIQTVFPGHGEVFYNANAIIDQQLARIEMRKEDCFQAIKSGLRTPYQINRKMYPFQMMPPDFSGLYMVLGYIDLLKMEGRIKQEESEEDLAMKWSVVD